MESNANKRKRSVSSVVERAPAGKRGTEYGGAGGGRATVAAISVATPPAKRKYLLGSVRPDLTGGALDTIYSDGTVRRIPMTNDMQAEPESLDVGDTNIQVRAFGKTAVYPITILEPRAVKAIVQEVQKKTDYEEGETLDLRGLVLSVLFNDESVKEVRGLEVSYELSKGEESVELNYMGAVFEVPVTVRKRTHEVHPVSLELASLPNKLDYKQGDRVFDPAGGGLMLQFSDGTRRPVPLSDAHIDGFDTSVAGPCELTATHQGFSYRFQINVEPAHVIGLRAGGKPKRVYQEGEPYSLEGVVVYAEFDSGESKPVTGYCADKETAHLGDKALFISYQGYTCEIAVEVMPKQPIAISIVQMPLKHAYFVGDAGIACEGGVLELSYEDGEKERIPPDSKCLEPYSLAEAGDKTIGVSYAGLHAHFDIQVREPPATGIEIVAMPKDEYTSGEFFDASALQIAVLYANGRRRILGHGEYKVHSSTQLTCSDTLVLITYGTMAAIVPITVHGSLETATSGGNSDANIQEGADETWDKSGQIPFFPFYPSTMSLRFAQEY